MVSGLLVVAVVVVVVVVMIIMVVRVVVVLFHCFTVWGSAGIICVVRVSLIVNMRSSLRLLRSMAKHAARLSGIRETVCVSLNAEAAGKLILSRPNGASHVSDCASSCRESFFALSPVVVCGLSLGGLPGSPVAWLS